MYYNHPQLLQVQGLYCIIKWEHTLFFFTLSLIFVPAHTHNVLILLYIRYVRCVKLYFYLIIYILYIILFSNRRKDKSCFNILHEYFGRACACAAMLLIGLNRGKVLSRVRARARAFRRYRVSRPNKPISRVSFILISRHVRNVTSSSLS